MVRDGFMTVDGSEQWLVNEFMMVDYGRDG